MESKRLEYRAYIDGIRALAVMAVIFYHLKIMPFTGGYLGVDIFFVISGFLITAIVSEDLEEKRFKFTKFYERRIRRIIPILYLVIFLTIPFVLIFFIEADLRNYFESIFSIITFSSNYLFWLEEGEYFTLENNLKPFLHTWSLSIEIQFYLFFPILLFFLTKNDKYKIRIIILLFILSFSISNILSFYNKDAAFYLSVTRVWEILGGALSYFILRQSESKNNYSEFISLVSILGIIFSIILFKDNTFHPGILTMIPIFSTVVLIIFCEKTKYIRKLLENNIICGLGKISYSLYIIHFPVLAILGYLEINLGNLDKFLFIIILICVSILSYKYIEKPFRDSKRIKRKKIFIYFFVTSAILLFAGLLGHLKIKDKTDDFVNNFFSSPKFNIEKSIMVLGDSHAAHYTWGLKEYFGDTMVEDYSSNGCIPFFDFDRIDSRFKEGECPKKINKALDRFINNKDFGFLILSNMGPVYLDGTTFKGKMEARVKGLKLNLKGYDDVTDRWKLFEIGMHNTFERLSKLPENKEIFYIIDIPELGAPARMCDMEGKKIKLFGIERVIKEPSYSKCFVSIEEFELRSSRYRKLVIEIASKYDKIKIIEPSEFICDENSCRGIINNKKIYKDPDHLSKFGSLYISNFISKILMDIKK